jgi:hypothetical protein
MGLGRGGQQAAGVGGWAGWTAAAALADSMAAGVGAQPVCSCPSLQQAGECVCSLLLHVWQQQLLSAWVMDCCSAVDAAAGGQLPQPFVPQ